MTRPSDPKRRFRIRRKTEQPEESLERTVAILQDKIKALEGKLAETEERLSDQDYAIVCMLANLVAFVHDLEATAGIAASSILQDSVKDSFRVYVESVVALSNAEARTKALIDLFPQWNDYIRQILAPPQ